MSDSSKSLPDTLWEHFSDALDHITGRAAEGVFRLAIWGEEMPLQAAAVSLAILGAGLWLLRRRT